MNQTSIPKSRLAQHPITPSTQFDLHDRFERTEESLALLRGVFLERKSMLLFGEASSGKSRLLQGIVRNHPDAAYVLASSSAREFLTACLRALQAGGNSPHVLGLMKGVSLVALRGAVLRELGGRERVLIIDQVQSPSNAMSRLIKDLNYYERTPVLFAAHSPHMEDIGGLRSLCFDRSCRRELKPFPVPFALEFTRYHADLSGLTATNLEEALRFIVELSHGYPGRILAMLRMAHQPAYRFDNSIKYRLIHVDYSMGVDSAKVPERQVPATLLRADK